MLEATQLNVRYGHIEALADISLTIGEGETVAILGANGAGKTTLMRAITGLIPLTNGTIAFAGDRIDGLSPDARAVRGISLAPEGRAILATLTVERNLFLGSTPLRRRLDRATARSAVEHGFERAYETFPILRERRDALAGSLSGGQQQMLTIARALMAEPRLLMLDEPSLGLAPKIVGEVYGLLHRLKSAGQALVVVEESAHQALDLADRALVLRTGRMHLSGPARSVRKDDRLREAYLGGDAPSLEQ